LPLAAGAAGLVTLHVRFHCSADCEVALAEERKYGVTGLDKAARMA
jgi:hypothetical protein